MPNLLDYDLQAVQDEYQGYLERQAEYRDGTVVVEVEKPVECECWPDIDDLEEPALAGRYYG